MNGAIAVSDWHGNERVWNLASRCHPSTNPGLKPREVACRLVGAQLRAREVARPTQPRTTLPCPFDRLINNRARTEELGFHYRLEIPRDKRVYGYYVMPILD